MEENGRAQKLDKVIYPNLWNGITLIYDRPPGGIIRSTYQIAAGSDPGQIVLRYNSPVHLSAAGNLVFEFNTGTMMASAPVAWQEIEGDRVPVDVAFDLESSKAAVHFTLGNYNPAFPLTIDPTLTWNTFLGGETGQDKAYAVAVDDSGNIFVAGDSGAEWGSPVNHATGTSPHVFVAKLNRKGELQWNTFMGGNANERCRGIAVDGSGNVYVGGDSNWGWGNPVNSFNSGGDVFVAKLNNSGETVWHTFMGSSSGEEGRGVSVDGSGNVYVTGLSVATWGAPVTAFAGSYCTFAAKLNSTSGATVWTTFIGTDTDSGGIAVDGTGSVYVVGNSQSTWGTPVIGHTGGDYNYDVFVAKLNSSGGPSWHTFMGSDSDADNDKGIAVDEDGNVYIAGDCGVAWGSPINNHAGSDDVFAAKLNSSGVRQWNTFLGSSSQDYGEGITVDRKGNVYMTGRSSYSWGNPVNDHAGTGNWDAFAVKLNNNGRRLWNTFMGCSSSDYGQAIAVDQKAYVYVTGWSYAEWGNPVTAYTDNYDAFVARLLKRALTPWKPLLLLDSSGE